MLKHLQYIKNTLDENWIECDCDKTGEKENDADLNDNVKSIVNNCNERLFGSQKIVPVILEEEEIKR